MSTPCPHCGYTYGTHTPYCPVAVEQVLQKPREHKLGWICPLCHTVHALSVLHCKCKANAGDIMP